MSRLSNFQTVSVDVQLTADTSIYATGDVLVDTTAVPIIGATPGGCVRGKIESITLIDKDAQSGALDIVFLDANKSLGTANAAVSISDANSLSILRVVPVSTYDVMKASDNSVARIDLAAPIPFTTQAGSGSFYVGLVSRDAKTYTASGLYLRLNVQLISESI